MKIRIDCDGVLANFVEGFLDVLRAQNPGRPFFYQDWKSWDARESVCSRAEDAAAWAYIAQTPGWALHLLPYYGVYAALQELRQLGTVSCLTAPPEHHVPTWKHDRERWLCLVLGLMPKEVIFAHNKGDVNGDVLIDDKWSNLVDFHEANPNALCLLIDQPWNQGEPKIPYFMRRRLAICKTLADAVRQVEVFKGAR